MPANPLEVAQFLQWDTKRRRVYLLALAQQESIETLPFLFKVVSQTEDQEILMDISNFVTAIGFKIVVPIIDYLKKPERNYKELFFFRSSLAALEYPDPGSYLISILDEKDPVMDKLVELYLKKLDLVAIPMIAQQFNKINKYVLMRVLKSIDIGRIMTLIREVGEIPNLEPILIKCFGIEAVEKHRSGFTPLY